MENSLPKGWIQCKLADVVNIIMGQSPDSATYNNKGIGLPFFQGKAEFTNLHPLVKKWCNAPLKIVDRNSVLLSVRAPVGTVNIADQKCCIGRGLTGLSFKYNSDNKFLFYLMQNIEEQLTSQSTGSTFESVSKKTVEQLVIPLPPLTEQNRIIAKLDIVLRKVTDSKTRLERIPLLLKNMRQAILAAAVSGDLTKDKFDRNKWVQQTGKDVFEFITSGSRGWAEHYSENGSLFIRVTNLDYDTIEINTAPNKNKYVSPPSNAEGIRTKVQPNDVLISITGDVGMVGLVSKNIGDAYVNQHVCLARPKTNILAPFIAYYISSKKGGRGYFDEVKKGATKFGLSLDDIRNLPINIPSIEEQKEIVLKVEELFAFADTIETGYQKAKAYFDKIPQAILTKAFKGELVKQDENDEPASELLKRIKQEKQSTAKPKTKQPAKRYKMHEGEDEVSLVAEGD